MEADDILIFEILGKIMYFKVKHSEVLEALNATVGTQADSMRGYLCLWYVT